MTWGRIAAGVAACLSLVSARLHAQDPLPPVRTDSLAQRAQSPPRGASAAGTTVLDTSKNARVGLPSGPTRRFSEPDSIMQLLIKRPGYTPTRFRSDSATIWADERRLQLLGRAMAEREGAVVEADTISYRERECVIDARGDPRLFDKGKVAVGAGIKYDTCRKRGVVLGAFTSFDAQGQTWFIRGTIAQDSSTTRIFAANATMTTCDLPEPHYSFKARRVKWLGDTILVARPVVLYIRDVPVLWLPFIFKDLTKRANQRKSGVLIPSLGLTDIIRTGSGYNRSVRNIGYFWAPNDYFDATLQLDWTSRVSLQYGVATRYKILDRFLDGSFAVNQIARADGGSTTNFALQHRQQFNLSTSLTASINYTTSASALLANTTDPRLTTQNINSQIGFQKTFAWGSLSLGGNRSQDISTKQISLSPTLAITPKTINLGNGATWSPTFNTSLNQVTNQPQTPLYLVRANGTVDTIVQSGSSRTFQWALATPVALKLFRFDNTLSYNDQQQTGRRAGSTYTQASGSGIPGDSVTVQSYANGSFQSSLDWNTAVSLPGLLQGKWNLTPSVGISNATSGAFAIRNNQTGGSWVTQTKSFRFALNSSPTFFGFFPGLFGFQRIRHSISPLLSWSYQPAANIPLAYAQAIAAPGQVPITRAPATQFITLGLSQVFEGKTKPLAGDSTGASARKVRLLSIQTGSVTYDFEQAKLPGRTGWTTQAVGNTLVSDLLPGFNLSLNHDLWRGQVGTDTAKFSPFLTNVQANFSLTGRTFRNLLALVGLAAKPTGPDRPGANDVYGGFVQQGVNTAYSGGNVPVTAFQQRSGAQTFFGNNGMGPSSAGFSATVNYTLSRFRPVEGIVGSAQPTQQNVGLNMSFRPTHYWAATWQTQFDFTAGKFVSQNISLQRELHDFRATFGYQRTAGGNTQFFLSVAMIAIPALKYDFNRTALER